MILEQTSFRFAPGVDMRQVEMTLRLARLAAEILHGAECVELQTRTRIDAVQRWVRVDTTHPVGRHLALVFCGFARREFGTESVTQHRGRRLGRHQRARRKAVPA